MSVSKSRLSHSIGLDSNAVQRSSILRSPPPHRSSIQSLTRTPPKAAPIHPPERVKTEKSDTNFPKKDTLLPVWQRTPFTAFTDFYREMGVKQYQMLAFDQFLQRWLFARDKREKETNDQEPKAISPAEYTAFFLPSLQHEIMKKTNLIKKKEILENYKTAKESDVDLWLKESWIFYIDRRVEHIRKGGQYLLAVRQNKPVTTPSINAQRIHYRSHKIIRPSPRRRCSISNPDDGTKLKSDSREISNKVLTLPKESNAENSITDMGVALATPSSGSTEKSKSRATFEQPHSSETSNTVGSASLKRPHSPQIDHSEPQDQSSANRSPKRQKISQSLDPVTRGILDTLWDNNKLDAESLVQYAIQKGVESQLQQ